MDTAIQTKTLCNLSEPEWQELNQVNHDKLEHIVTAHRQRAINGEKHPIIDFLFQYYHFKPAKLLQWTPGINCYLLGDEADQFLTQKGFSKNNQGVYVDPLSFPPDRMPGLEWTINLLEKTLARKPQFNCFGLHEWCMIYEQSDIRHKHLPLRLTHQQTRKVVEQTPIQCTHYDAYRFYSTTAVNLNKIELNRNDMPNNEQPGCLHANMDLYRWAYKFHPWVGSELITATFLLAMEIREVDMRASPYDLSAYTTNPAIAVETSPGKAEYVELQRQFSERAKTLREKLINKLMELRELLLSNSVEQTY